MEGPGSYNKNQNIKYRNPEAVKEKWIRIFRDINPYTDPATMLHSIKEAFTLVECVMRNILFDYRKEYISYGVPVPNTKNTYVFHYESGDVVIDFMDHSVFGMTKSLRAIGYNLPDEINDTRKLRNFISHNLETTTIDYFRDNMNYESVLQAVYNLGQSLVAMGMLRPEDIQPDFDSLRVKEGEVLGLSNEFVVDRLIAKSGSCRLYEGRHTRLNRRVAIKELLPKTFSEVLLNNERDLLVSLSHSRIPHIYDVFNQNGTFYIVMDYIDGVGLDKYISQNRCTMEEKLRIIYDICDVVNYMHATKGMVHADLKPQNVMVDENSDVYIIDFGTAINKHEKEKVRGVSAGYTAPEVTSGKPIDYRIDIYSIGAIMKYVFDGELKNSEERYSENTEAIRRIITRCMEYEPYARYNNVVEIQSEINCILNNGTVSLGRVAKPKKHINVPRILLYIVCVTTIVFSFAIKIKNYIEENRRNETDTRITESSNEADTDMSAGNDVDGGFVQQTEGEVKAVTDEEALAAFKELEQQAWDCLVSGDEDAYVGLFRFEAAGESTLRENFRLYHNDMQDIYDDCDYVLLCNENGLCYGSATRTLVSGRGENVSFVRREFTYPFSYKDGEWKMDITSQTGVVTENKMLDKVYNALTDNFNDARKSGRNYALLCANNYIWLDNTLVYEGMLEGSVVAASQMMDGGVELTISIKNGTGKEQTINACVVNLATTQGNEIVTDYRAEVNATVKAGTSMLVSFTVPKESVKNIAAVWNDMQADVIME